ncbi:MAG: cytochrome c family protein [Myxococcales bacterium]|nr:cytochrome c family protein [Myxococcales bacterium]MDH5306766.1 cytochrome c family protein [Myxococcales bacterium]MDH5565224.1 cytochrome c family protein [Myxococcales bacterium]
MSIVSRRTLDAFESCVRLWRARSWRLAALGVPAALLVLVLPAAASADHDDEHEGREYVGASKCKTCHKKDTIGNQYGKWLESRHAKAYETLASEQSAKWAAEAGVSDPQNDARCVKCHVTAYGVSQERLSMKFDRTQGVQCEACHGPGEDYRKKKIMMNRELALSKGLILPVEENCVTCHNEDSPAWNPERYTRADGSKVGFDFEQAAAAIAHPVPESYDPRGEGEAD